LEKRGRKKGAPSSGLPNEPCGNYEAQRVGGPGGIGKKEGSLKS